MRVLFVAPYPKGIGPSQRFRFEHYLPYLSQHNITYDYNTFFNEKDYKELYKQGNYINKVRTVLKGFLKRIALLFKLSPYAIIYIHREITPVGPPVFEWVIAKIFKKRVVYDFDDAIWIPMSSASNPFAAKIKAAWKVKYICKWSQAVSVGNDYLAAYARKFNKNVIIIPTVVNTLTTHNQIKIFDAARKPVIGWTGTFTNFVNLDIVLPAIQKLQEKTTFDFLIIADKDPLLKHVKYTYKKWNKDTEIADLLLMDVGIMPLFDEEIQKGKCAFKAIQYMALGIPSVVSPVGANCYVVDPNVNGFWAANTTNEWVEALNKLLENVGLRRNFGKAAHEKIKQKFSVDSTVNNFINLLHTN